MHLHPVHIMYTTFARSANPPLLHYGRQWQWRWENTLSSNLSRRRKPTETPESENEVPPMFFAFACGKKRESKNRSLKNTVFLTSYLALHAKSNEICVKMCHQGQRASFAAKTTKKCVSMGSTTFCASETIPLKTKVSKRTRGKPSAGLIM